MNTPHPAEAFPLAKTAVAWVGAAVGAASEPAATTALGLPDWVHIVAIIGTAAAAVYTILNIVVLVRDKIMRDTYVDPRE